MFCAQVLLSEAFALEALLGLRSAPSDQSAQQGEGSDERRRFVATVRRMNASREQLDRMFCTRDGEPTVDLSTLLA